MKNSTKQLSLTMLVMFSCLTAFINASNSQSYKEIPLEQFSCYSNFYSFSMSPDGKYLAVLTTPKKNECDIHPNKMERVEKNFRYQGLTMIKVSDMSRKVLFDGTPGNGISSFNWLSNERFSFMPQAFEQVGRSMSALQVFAMNVDGSRKRSLLEYQFGAEGLRGFDVYNTNPEVDDEVFVYWNKRRSRVSDYYKLNINTGVPRLIARGPDIADSEVIYFSVEDDDGYPVTVMTDVGIQRVLYTYDKNSKKWSEHYRYTCQQPHFTPVSLLKDGRWLVSGQKFDTNGNVIEDLDKNALYIYNPETREFSEKVFSDDVYDIGGFTGGCRSGTPMSANVNSKTGQLRSLTYAGAEPTTLYFDDSANEINDEADEETDEVKFSTRQLKESLQSIFPDDWVSVTTSDGNNTKGVFRVYNSNNPGDYYYFDLTKGQVFMLYQNSPWLDRDVLSKKQLVKYKARDGLTITGYLSLTKKQTDKNYFIILPHGGPNVKEGFGYDGWVQFLTNRGYNVLQPDYRGSTGYGRNHYVLGNRQWGKSMQDDLTDGVYWAIENGYADQDRVCIAGGSYGGYAAMAGAVFTPDLYRCVINFVGVADMRDLLKGFGSKSSRFNTWEDEGRLEWGDDKGPESDKYISEISPLLHVENIQAPVLISHGTNDNIVPVEHARRLRSEMEKYGKTYEWHMQAYEGHGFGGELARLEHYQVQEKFLKKYLEN